jgi:hypothetical protein
MTFLHNYSGHCHFDEGEEKPVQGEGFLPLIEMALIQT